MIRISHDDIEAFRRIYRDECQIDLSVDEARAVLQRILLLFEQFAVWLAKERAAGRPTFGA
jgi:hypothetical protein